MQNRAGLLSSLQVLLPGAGMELCRWYITAGLLFLIPGGENVPFLLSGCTLLSAMFLAMLMSRLKRRRITELAVHSLGGVFFLCLTLKSYAGLPFSNSKDVSAFIEAFARISSPSEWFSFSMILAWILLLWLRGRHLGVLGTDYSRTLARFDMGMMQIFGIYFLRMGIHIQDPQAISTVPAFLIFGILSIYAARNLNRDHGFIHRSSASGLILLFAAGCTLAGTAEVILYPAMTQTAETAYSLIKKGARPLQPVIIAILRFLFGRRAGVPAQSLDSGPSSQFLSPGPPQEPGFWVQLLEKILGYSLAVILAVSGLLITGYIFWRLLVHLSSHAGNEKEGVSFGKFLRMLIRRIIDGKDAFVRILLTLPGHFLRRRIRTPGPASTAFRKLNSWARLSGEKRSPHETAREYGLRLAEGFPAVSRAVMTIVKYAETETYSERTLSAEEILELRRAGSKTGRFRLLIPRLQHRSRQLRRTFPSTR